MLNSQNLTDDDTRVIIRSFLDKHPLESVQIDSFNDFVSLGISQIITDVFEIRISVKNKREETEEDKSIESIEILITFDDVIVEKPRNEHVDMKQRDVFYPNLARKNKLNYSSDILINATIQAKAYLKTGGDPLYRKETIKNFKIASIPMMVGSALCNTYKLPKSSLKELEEDPQDLGGYFILKGIEWVINMLESRTFNIPHIFITEGHQNELVRMELISKPGDRYENSSELMIRLFNDNNLYFTITTDVFANNYIPFYIIFKLLGMMETETIFDNIVYGYSTSETIDLISNNMVSVLIKALNAENSLSYLAQESDSKIILDDTVNYLVLGYKERFPDTTEESLRNTKIYLDKNIMRILDNKLLPHIGVLPEDRFRKARYLGYLLHKFFLVQQRVYPETDRDSLEFKRIMSSGDSLSKTLKRDLNDVVISPIKSYFRKNINSIGFSELNLSSIFIGAVNTQALDSAITKSIKTGDDEIKINNKIIVNRLASEMLNRKNYTNYLSSLRTVRTANSSASKQTQRSEDIRKMHPTYMHVYDPFQSANTGTQVGLVKQLCITCLITRPSSSIMLKQIILKEDIVCDMNYISPKEIYAQNLTAILVNGDLIAYTKFPEIFWYRFKYYKCGYEFKDFNTVPKKLDDFIIDPYTTVYWNHMANEISLWVDPGRAMAPYIKVYNNGETDPWGRHYFGSSYDPIKDEGFIQDVLLSKEHIDGLKKKIISLDDLLREGIIEFLSVEDLKNSVICEAVRLLATHKNNPLLQYTHCCIPESMLGIVMLASPLANHNVPPRSTFASNQRKQTIGCYALNWPYRYDKHAYLQHYLQSPICTTLTDSYVFPDGFNATLVIMTYNGFNQEDSLIINKTAAQRGLYACSNFGFATTEISKEEKITNPDPSITADVKESSSYKHLVDGLPRVGAIIEPNDVIIGKIAEVPNRRDGILFKDNSIIYKGKEKARIEGIIRERDQEDKEFIKVKYSTIRKVNIGDKFCLSKEHWVLSTSGWKQIDKIEVGDRILSLVDGEMFYKKVKKLHRYENCDLQILNPDDIGLIFTREHKHYISYDGYKWSYVLAEHMTTGESVYFKSEDEIFQRNILIINCGKDNAYCPDIGGYPFLVKTVIGTTLFTGNSSRAGQKGMTSIALKREDMPFCEDGLVPDIIMNPHSIPTRMTMNQLIENYVGVIGANKGTTFDMTSFRKINILELRKEMAKLGYNSQGTRRIYNGETGEWMDAEVFVGIIYYLRLQKFAIENSYSMNTGPTSSITRQPISGKSKGGGVRIGEMEKDVLVASGVSRALTEKWREDSDAFSIYICRTCKKKAIVNKERNIYWCNYCVSKGLEQDIKKIKTTWSSNLFIDEIESMFVKIDYELDDLYYNDTLT